MSQPPGSLLTVAPAFLTAEWRWLVMLNYEVDPDSLRALVPAGTELDEWQGRTYVSLVGFRFQNTRLRGVAFPCHRNFSEVNLRFYVRHRHGSDWRRGVVFIKEIVALPAVTLIARRVYNENYITLPMRHEIKLPAASNDQQGEFRYGWRWRRQWIDLSAETHGPLKPIAANSEAEFITEHYWGYTRQRDGRTMEYQVEHPRWNHWPLENCQLTGDVASLYGSEFGPVLQGRPTSAFVADGSEIVVRRGAHLLPDDN